MFFSALTSSDVLRSGPLAIDHAVMTSAIDVEPVREALIRLGFKNEGYQLSPEQRSRVQVVLAKAEASRNGDIGGKRHIMLDDSDISSVIYHINY